MTPTDTFLIHDEKELHGVVRSIRTLLDAYTRSEGGVTVVLTGELGAGKTTLVKYLAESYGMTKEDVSSPTYVLERVYVNGALTISHWDLYRVQELPEEFYEEAPKGVIRFVEWGERFGNLKCELRIIFNLEADGRRSIAVYKG